MNPAQLAKSGSESSEQIALFAMCALNINKYPELIWYHSIPNGAVLGNDERTRIIRAGRLKAEGMKNGVHDTFLPVKRGCFSGLYIEMKKRSEKPVKETSKGGLNDDQIAFGKFVTEQGFLWVCAYGWEEAWSYLEQYLNIK